MNSWIWYGTPALVLLLALIALLSYGRLWRRQFSAPPAATPPPPPKPLVSNSFAFLTLSGPEHQRITVNASPWRIGRSRHNDLTLDDHSVSRLHAEIQRTAEGLFVIVDMESLNGVFVNEIKISHAALADGDRIDIGDLSLKFTLHNAEEADLDPTERGALTTGNAPQSPAQD